MRTLLAVPVAVAVLGTAVGAGARSAACGWRVVAGVPGTSLAAVSAPADDDVWAVGSGVSRALVVHWNGRRWSTTQSAVLGTALVGLDVEARSARDVWVVGVTSTPGGSAASEHWNGSRWKVVPVPGTIGSNLRAVSGSWAVGAGFPGPLVVHWNGTVWLPVASGVRDGLLHAIDGTWAVGTRGMSSATGSGSEDPLVVRVAPRVHAVATPTLDSVDENLLGVHSDSTHDVWAVGSEDVLGGRAPLVQHFDGRVWRDESTVGLPSSQSALAAVAAFGPADVWTAGYRGFADQRALLAHWDGSRWTQSLPARSGALSDLSAISSHDIWAVGESHVGKGTRSLIEHYACR